MGKVTNLNFDPNRVRPQDKAIIEYNRLRKKYRPDLSTLNETTSLKL